MGGEKEGMSSWKVTSINIIGILHEGKRHKKLLHGGIANEDSF